MHAFVRTGAIATILSMMLVSSLPAYVGAQAADYPPGTQVEGRFVGSWIPCTVVGERLPTGGYVLHCPALPDDNVFSRTDVRPVGAGPARAAKKAAAVAQGHPVEGHVDDHWEPCTQVGGQLPTGGFRLSCKSRPAINVYSATDVRPVGGTAARAARKEAALAQGHPVEGHVDDHWEPCTQVGGQLPTGGFRLSCKSRPAINVYSATDVREIGGAPPAAAAPKPPAAPQGRRVQGFVAGRWEGCTMVGDRLPTGGYVLRCDSHPDVEAVFSATDVRL